MRLDHLVHEIRWSNGTQVVQPHLSGPSGPAASRHARRRPTMRDNRWGGAGAERWPHPPPPGPPGSTVRLSGPDDPSEPDRPRRPDRRSRRAERPASVARYGGDPLRGPALRRGTRPRKGGRRVLHRPGSTAVRRGRAFLTGRDGPWVRRRCGGGDGRARGGADGAPGTILGGACPNLLQRRPATGSAENKSPKYQRFSSGAPARSGPLQQIWTTDPPVD